MSNYHTKMAWTTVRVKVDGSAEANILLFRFFQDHVSSCTEPTHGYPKDGFLRGSRTNLECYDDGRLVNHGSIKLRLSALLRISHFKTIIFML